MARIGRAAPRIAIIQRAPAILPAVLLANRGSGQADETTVTTGNSAAGGHAWDTVTIGADATVVYDVVGADTWYRFATGATSSSARVEWAASVGAGAWRIYGRAYFRIPAASLGSTTFYLLRLRSGSTQTARVSVSTANRLQLRNSGNSVAATGTVDIAADTAYRVEWDVTVGSSAPGEVRLFLGHATTPIDTVSVSSADFGTSIINEAAFGVMAAASNHAPYLLRGFQLNSTAMPGPLGGGDASGTDVADLADTGSAAAERSRSGADTADAADTGAPAATRQRTGTDTADLADAGTAGTTYSRTGTDSAEAADAGSGATSRTRTGGDTADTVDAGTTAAGRARTGADSADVADQGGQGTSRSRSGASVADVADTATGQAARQRAGADAGDLVDQGQAAAGQARAGLDGADVQDAATTTWSRSRSGADEAALTDAGVAVLAGPGESGGADAAELVDAGTRGLQLARQGADVGDLADVAASELARARAGGDGAALQDAATWLSARARSALDAAALTDAGVAVLTPDAGTEPGRYTASATDPGLHASAQGTLTASTAW